MLHDADVQAQGVGRAQGGSGRHMRIGQAPGSGRRQGLEKTEMNFNNCSNWGEGLC